MVLGNTFLLTAESLTPVAHYLRPLTDVIVLKMHCGSVHSFGSVACVKCWEMLHFWSAATDQLGNQITVMQIHYWDATWTVQWNRLCDTTPRGYVKNPASSRGFKNGGERYHCCKKSANSVWAFPVHVQRQHSPCDYRIHFAITTTSRKTQ